MIDATDPEGDAIHYEVAVYVGDPERDPPVLVAPAGNGFGGATIDQLPVGALSWRARGIDALGAIGPWSRPATFTALPGGGTTGGCGCALGARPARGGSADERALASLLAVVLALSVRVARSRRAR